MNSKTMTLLVSLGFGVLLPVHAANLVPVTNDDTPRVSYRIVNDKGQASNSFVSGEAITIQFSLEVAAQDLGQTAGLYLAAQYQDQWYARSPDGNWRPWDGKADSLPAFSRITLTENEVIGALEDSSLPPGEFLVHAGYKADAGDQLFYNDAPAALIVFEQDSAALHKIKHKPVLANFFALGSSTTNPFIDDGMVMLEGDAATSAGVSMTNLQEAGVDEGDRIKTDGEILYAVERCEADGNQQCIGAYTITADPASYTRLSQLNTEDDQWRQASLYLSEIEGTQYLLHLSDSLSIPMFAIWHAPNYWQGNQTDVRFVDVSLPEQMKMGPHISINASLLSSRLIGNVLYLVTRNNAYFDYPIVAFDTAAASNGARDPFNIPPQQDVEDLLPKISFNDGSGESPLVSAGDCFIPRQTSDKPVNNTIVTITAIPLNNPKGHYSSCIAGAVDTFYMSSEALYLATSRYPYTIAGNAISYPENDEITTEIHKFALNADTLDYRGSGSVPGHLGWNAEKQPFRMGEYNGILKVATSKGETWLGDATTRVAVLAESRDNRSLTEIAFLDNLGKPGEQLYAARFLGDRGYLVTFRVTDPLYVLDFSDPASPQVVGELEINGYSDYLHPIGENYLLGIGKDAIPDNDADRGAWYQGLKLSLFDVSDGRNLREVESQIIGKRGSESAALYDHHALAWLENGDSATLALPVQMNETESQSGQDYIQPQAYYDWTHTGLYSFSVNTGADPGIELLGRLITDTAPAVCEKDVECYAYDGQYTDNDRAVIQGSSVHYIHNDSVYSSAIADLE